MAYEAQVYRILIASPSDVSEERDLVTQCIQEWNDLNGNLLSDGYRTFTYDDENELTSVVVSNGVNTPTLTTNIYDGRMRRRIRKDYTWSSGWIQTAEVHYIYDGNLVIQERDGNNLPLVSYTRGKDLSGSLQGAGGIGGLLARTDNTQTAVPGSQSANAYYHCDGNGNITALVDANQYLCAKYEYDPFGNITSLSGSLATANTYRFSSKDFQPTNGLCYFGRRFYDPNLQRWLNRDPIGEVDDFNLFVYVRQNPITESDSIGLQQVSGMLGAGEVGIMVNGAYTGGNEGQLTFGLKFGPVAGAALSFNAAPAELHAPGTYLEAAGSFKLPGSILRSS